MTERDLALVNAGFVSATIVAQKLGVNRSTICRWVDRGEIKGVVVGGKRFLNLQSVIEKVTPEVAKIVGLVEEKST